MGNSDFMRFRAGDGGNLFPYKATEALCFFKFGVGGRFNADDEAYYRGVFGNKL